MCLAVSSLWATARRPLRRRKGGAGMTARLLAARHRTGSARRLRVGGTVRRLRAAGTARGSGRRALSSWHRSISARSPLPPSGSFRCSIGCTAVGVTGTSASGSPSTDATNAFRVADRSSQVCSLRGKALTKQRPASSPPALAEDYRAARQQRAGQGHADAHQLEPSDLHHTIELSPAGSSVG